MKYHIFIFIFFIMQHIPQLYSRGEDIPPVAEYEVSPGIFLTPERQKKLEEEKAAGIQSGSGQGEGKKRHRKKRRPKQASQFI